MVKQEKEKSEEDSQETDEQKETSRELKEWADSESKKMSQEQDPREKNEKESSNVPKKKRNPTEILEARKNYDLEGAYFRQSGEEFQDVAHSHSRFSVIPDCSKLKKGKFYTSLHTHPLGPEDVQSELVLNEQGETLRGPNIPSEGDMRDFLQRPYEKTMAIAQQDPKTGEVSGYLLIRKTKKTPKIPEVPANQADLDNALDKNMEKELREKLADYTQLPEVKRLERDLYNDYHAPTLFEGEYNTKKDKFIPKRGPDGKPIERKVQSGEFYTELMNKFMDKYGLHFRAAVNSGYRYEKGIGFKKK